MSESRFIVEGGYPCDVAPRLHEAPALPPAPAPVPERKRLLATTQVLRFGGALLLTVASSSFLLQHWQSGSSATRYACLLGHTLLLAISGIVCGLRVRESRAARTFFGLVLASVPVHFAALGGMLRSVFPLDGAGGPSDLWPLHSVPLALCLLGVGLGLMAPLAHLALLTLVRPCARDLTRATLAMNTCLLLPWRAPVVIAAMTGAMLVSVFALDARVARTGYAARTPDARFARALLAAPIAIAITRAALWYHPTQLACGAFAACIGLALFFAAPRLSAVLGSERVQSCAAALAAGGTTCVALAIPAAVLPAGTAVPFHVLPGCALLALLSCFARGSGASFRCTAALASGTALVLAVCGAWSTDAPTWAGVIALGIGSAMLAGGVYAGQRLPFIAGALPALLGLVQLFVASIEFERLRSWGALSVLGGVLIFAAALLERHGERFLRATRALTTRLSSW